METSKTRLKVLYSILFLFFIALLVQEYLLYSMHKDLQALSATTATQLSTLNKTTAEQFDTVGLQLVLLELNLSSTQHDLSQGISRLRQDYLSDITSLTGVVEQKQLEQQRELQTLQSNLKDELQSLQVQSQDFTSVIQDALQGTVSVITNKGQGSGAIIDKDGYIVTNYHVISGATQFRVLMYDKKLYQAVPIAVHQGWDIAVLKIDDEDLPVLSFDDSNRVKVGEKVIALGNPQGYDFTVTEGIISAVDRQGPNGLDGYLQTDVPLNPGNSGGPLVNLKGKIIGINNWKAGDSESLGFAIPSNIVKDITDEIIDTYKAQLAAS